MQDANHFAPIRTVLIESGRSGAARGKFSEKIFNRLIVARAAVTARRCKPKICRGREKILSWIVVSVLQISIVRRCFFSFADAVR
ncbi:MAG: hypothetical protein J0H78_00255 [Rhizobiales bacterium]|nr:hypothetical protein [Hyphomicrobiales bacterium]